MKKCFELVVFAEERIEHFLRRERGRHWEVATSQSFGQAQVIRLNAHARAGEEPCLGWLLHYPCDGFLRHMTRHAGASEPSHHLVCDELRAMPARQIRHLPQPARGLRNHPRRALHQRLEDKRRVRFPALFPRRKFLLHLPHALPVTLAIFARVLPLRRGAVERTAIAVRRHHWVGFEQHPAVGFVEEINMAEAHRANRVAVIRALERKKPGLL